MINQEQVKFTEEKVKEFQEWFAQRERAAVLTQRDTEPAANDGKEVLGDTGWLDNWHALRSAKE